MRRVIPGLETPESPLESEIGTRLDRVEEELEKAVAADSDLLSATARYLLQAGGKRFRPMLVLLAGYFGESADRRGVPSANARWDNTVAILTGDYLFALASEMSADLGPDVCRLLARTITVLCDGQIREVDAAGRVGQDEDGYLEVIRRKTGSLIATSCRLGGTLSDATPEQVETLEAFGESLGLAFQLSDDIMDITSNQLELGKEPGTDMKEGVYTLPVLHALHRGPDREELQRLLAPGAPDGERLDRALQIVRGEGSIGHARGAVTDEVRRAVSLATQLPDGTARHALVQLTRFLAIRCGADPGEDDA